MTCHDVISRLTQYGRNFALKPFLALLCLDLGCVLLYSTLTLDILLAFELETTGRWLNLILGGKLAPPAGCCHCFCPLEGQLSLEWTEEEDSPEGMPQIGTMTRP